MSNPIISQDEMTALLGRSLSDVEKSNYELYLNIASLRIEDLLCIKLADFNPLPADLELLVARCFDAITKEQEKTASYGISNKKVEDFSISYESDSASPMVEFVRINSSIIDKYGQCQGPVRSGKVFCGCSF